MERSLSGSIHSFVKGNGSILQECDVEEGDEYEAIKVKQNVCYIVAAIVIDDNGRVLMVQEAKVSCYKKWYLPAGRMEPNETIVEAVKREVLEEAGLEFEPTSLLCVEECGGRWVRFALVGKVTGGKLKTTEEADEESLQAMWWDREEKIQIRCKDVLPLIELGVKRHETDPSKSVVLLPSLEPQKLLFIRALMIYKQPANDQDISILLEQTSFENREESSNVDDKGKYCVPTSRIHQDDISFHRAVHAICKDLLQLNQHSDYSITILGVMNIEHTGASSMGHDGLGVSIIVELKIDNSCNGPPICKPNYKWVKLSELPVDENVTLLKKKLNPSNLIPLRSLKAKL
uniref:8-oxo-dGDP phosphatase NUDT18-like n=1 Tax=Styela clava TaxID=7725 RepID=UPI00193AB5C8|nr:8-oxo-dGDP phosphatase NUDT18-like [Styela clava]